MPRPFLRQQCKVSPSSFLGCDKDTKKIRCAQARHVVLRVDIDILRLDGTPEALYPDVVLAASTAIHADPDAESLASGQPQAARILAALVGVDDLRRAMGFRCQPEHRNTVLLVQRVVQSPCHDTAAVHVYYRRQVHEPVKHRYIGDVNAPDLIGEGYVEATEQIGHRVLRLTKSGQAFPRVYRGNAHFAHQPADTFGTDNEALQEQVIHRPQRPWWDAPCAPCLSPSSSQGSPRTHPWACSSMHPC